MRSPLLALLTIVTACGTASIDPLAEPPPEPGPRVDGGSGPIDPTQPVKTKSEVCGNGLDDNANGDVDEGCGCSAGATQPCFPGPADRKDKGICRTGTQTCRGDSEFLSWGRCEGGVGPKPELCGDGIDQDCDGKDEPCPPKGQCETFAFGTNARPVDIVWVIDQSGSMNQEIAMVRQNMNAFASFISSQKIDFRVIVVAARTTSNGICIPQPLAGPACSDGPRFLQLNHVINSHDALARLTLQAASIEAFMRPGSVRHFVAVTDDESIPMTAGQFDAFFRPRPDFKDYVFHSIVGLAPGGCVASEGKQYKALSTLTKGLQYHICNANWQQLFGELAKNIVTAITKYKLSGTPKPGTVKVWLDAAPATQGTDFDYDPLVNQVVILKQPADGTKIKICYDA